jgi:hypothetical protein
MEGDSLTKEETLIQSWLKMYRKTLERAQEGIRPLTAGPMTTLCPVSYKTLEFAFKHEIPGF